jgi:hypothetical protein
LNAEKDAKMAKIGINLYNFSFSEIKPKEINLDVVYGYARE